MTLLSRISGLIRDVVFANLLGDKAAADVFFVAFRIPNFFRRITAEGAFSAAFIPVFTEYRLQKNEAEIRDFLQLLIGRFGLILLLFSIMGVIFAPVLVSVLATGFLEDPEKFELTVRSARITFPYLFFISLVATAAGMLNTCGRFAVPAATPILLNICLIFAALVLVPRWQESPVALSAGVLAAGVVQLLFQIPFLKREKITIRPRLRTTKTNTVGAQGVTKVFKLIVPAIFGVSVAQVNVLINTLLASFMVTGSISWLYYSDRLMEFPVGVFGIALGTAVLPSLSMQHRQQSPAAFSATLDWASRWVWLVCVPATVGLVILSRPIVTTIYFHGDFTQNGVFMSAASLVAFSVGLTAIVLVKILALGFYARQNTETPVKIGMIAVATNIGFSLVLFYPLQHVGLALATSIAAVFNAALLYRQLKKENIFCPVPGWFMYLSRVMMASAVMGLVIWWAMAEPEKWLIMDIWERVVRLSSLIAIGIAVYFVGLRLLGLDLQALWREKEV